MPRRPVLFLDLDAVLLDTQGAVIAELVKRGEKAAAPKAEEIAATAFTPAVRVIVMT